ncbi:substrate-binding periplasmic protein [Kordiimonas sp.]|uniref:substrate-binding periplasmic protein n=1 Tax=Kordiimonas sp. TaxID=1970157 RepID=UPI003A92C22B
MKSLVLLLGLVLQIGASAIADDRPSLAVTYYHYPPHLKIEDGKPAGHYVEQLTKIAEKAGYRVAWQFSSIDEEARMLDDGRRLFCTTGRLRTPERAKNWTFLPYIFDVVPGDLVVAAPQYADRIRELGSLDKLAHDKSLIGTLLESGVYGEEFDKILNDEHPRWILRTGKTDFQLLNMILAGRAHYAIVPEDQWHFAMEENPEVSTLVPIHDLGTIPALPIYIACSRSLPQNTLSALEQAMADLGFAHRPLSNETPLH